MFDEKALNEKIYEILDTDLEQRDAFFEKIKSLIVETQDEAIVYQNIIYTLSHVMLKPQEALTHWHKIISHKNTLSDKLGRQVAFRVALLNYFIQNNGFFHDASVVDLYIYESAKYNTMTDGLTGLYNHRFLREFLWKESRRALRYSKNFSIVVIDIDDFKQMNDSYGQLTGDEILQHIGKILEQGIRLEDIAARFGGDEFVMILPETNKDSAGTFAERIKELIESAPFSVGLSEISIHISMGISSYPEDAKDPVDLLDIAYKAVYHAKFLGKNQIISYYPDMTK